MAIDKQKVRTLNAKCHAHNPSYDVYLEAIDMATNTVIDALGDYERSFAPITTLASNITTSPEILDNIARVVVHSSILLPLVQNPSTSAKTLEFFFSKDDFVFYPRSSALNEVRLWAGVNPNAKAKTVELAWKLFLADPISNFENEISDKTSFSMSSLGNYISYILGNPNAPQYIRDQAIEKYLPAVYGHQVHRIIIDDDIITHLRNQPNKEIPSRFISHPDLPVEMLEGFLADTSMSYQHEYVLRNPSLPLETFVSHLKDKQIHDLHITAAGYKLSASKLAALWELYKNRTLVYSGLMSNDDVYFWNNYILNKNTDVQVVDEIVRLSIAKKQDEPLSSFLRIGKGSQESYAAALDHGKIDSLDIRRAVLKNKHIDVTTLIPYIESGKHDLKKYVVKNDDFLSRVKEHLIQEGTLTEDARSLPNSWIVSVLGW